MRTTTDESSKLNNVKNKTKIDRTQDNVKEEMLDGKSFDVLLKEAEEKFQALKDDEVFCLADLEQLNEQLSAIKKETDCDRRRLDLALFRRHLKKFEERQQRLERMAAASCYFMDDFL